MKGPSIMLHHNWNKCSQKNVSVSFKRKGPQISSVTFIMTEMAKAFPNKNSAMITDVAKYLRISLTIPNINGGGPPSQPWKRKAVEDR
jgi:hypothetical protein